MKAPWRDRRLIALLAATVLAGLLAAHLHRTAGQAERRLTGLAIDRRFADVHSRIYDTRIAGSLDRTITEGRLAAGDRVAFYGLADRFEALHVADRAATSPERAATFRLAEAWDFRIAEGLDADGTVTDGEVLRLARDSDFRDALADAEADARTRIDGARDAAERRRALGRVGRWVALLACAGCLVLLRRRARRARAVTTGDNITKM